ncbi:hypothetical protein F0562_016587 [Nyssa sinensis]|uniref:CID domain-containing protein n=1 Tax=Nyssa sinensis TaxID=561372 RepID=A0A5J4ZEP6_9ASTE|nr:hypothetical protein F0562_016587 [Nyssa sinensis]
MTYCKIAGERGSEFVNEFWKVLPAALKHVYENGDEQGKKAASRLVDIWEERKVFGSRGQNLKDEMLGKVPPLSVSNGKSSNPIKVVKRDAHSLRIKLAVGGTPEKIVTAFQSVHDENVSEDAALNKCKAAVRRVGKMEKDIESTSTQGNQQGSALLDEIQEHENILQQCVRQLESAEATRATLVSQLREALQDQESKLEVIHTQLQVARGQIEQMSNIRQRFTAPPLPAPLTITINTPMEVSKVVEPSLPSVQPTSTPPPPLVQPVVSFATLKTTEEENKKAAAAAVAAKLAASASSAQMLTSVLSSLVAEEAASMSGGLKSAGFAPGLPMFSPEKRLKVEKPLSVSDVNNSDTSTTAYFTTLQQQPTSVQPISQANQIQAPFPPPLPPPMPPAHSPANQFVQSAGPMVGVMPYGYGANSLPPPPPLPSHIAMGLARPAPQPPQQQPANGGYYRPPGYWILWTEPSTNNANST